MFTVIQQAFTFLSDDQKRKALDRRLAQARDEEERQKKQSELSERRRQGVERAYTSTGKSSFRNNKTSSFSVAGVRYGSGNGSQVGGQQTDLNHFAQNSRETRPKSAPSQRMRKNIASPSEDMFKPEHCGSCIGAVPKHVTSRPKHLRLIERSNCSATLTWSHADFDKKSMSSATPGVLFEIQWRSRMERALPLWETSSFLLRSNVCRKKNLKNSTCYEFRVRATSTNGNWSAFSNTAFVVTHSKAPLKSHAIPRSATEKEEAVGASRENQCAADHKQFRTSVESTENSKGKCEGGQNSFSQRHDDADSSTKSFTQNSRRTYSGLNNSTHWKCEECRCCTKTKS